MEAVLGVDSEKTRFEAELEFVQSLSNPAYLHYLAQHRFLDDPDFVHYLDYLRYWQEPQYVRYLVFPDCLSFLERLSDAAFRASLKREDVTAALHMHQHDAWRHRHAVLSAARSAGLLAAFRAITPGRGVEAVLSHSHPGP